MFCVVAKNDVKFAHISPAGFRLLWAIGCLPDNLKRDVQITCGTEGHPITDPHSLGSAYDIGVTGWSDQNIIDAVSALRQLLGSAFYIQFEVPSATTLSPALRALAVVNPAATAPHIHTQRAKGTIYAGQP